MRAFRDGLSTGRAFFWVKEAIDVKEVILTPEGYKKLKDEIQYLDRQTREVADRIASPASSATSARTTSTTTRRTSRRCSSTRSPSSRSA